MHSIKSVNVGGVVIGGNAPVSIQSMINVPITDTKRAIESINELADAGCQIIRAAVPDEESAASLKAVLANISIPLVADIHFDYRLAISAIEAGVAKVRINPGNIGSRERIAAVSACLKEHGIPVRIGVNGGSLEHDILKKYGAPTAAAVTESAVRAIDAFAEFGVEDIVVSIKSSSAATTYEANMYFAARYPQYPLHLGVTEAGAHMSGIINSAAGIGAMLLGGIGDTVRVSLTGDPLQEVIAAKEILSACGLRREGVRIISCPTCGRTKTDTLKIVEELREATKNIKNNITVAVMGCCVNGPGEAKEADIGVACAEGRGVIFKNGKAFRGAAEADITAVLLEEISKMIAAGNEETQTK